MLRVLIAVDIMCLRLQIITFLNFRSICAVNLDLHYVGAAEDGSDRGRFTDASGWLKGGFKPGLKITTLSFGERSRHS